MPDSDLSAWWSSPAMLRARDAGRYGEIIKQARARQGWTQAELGRHCDCSPSVISRLETGDQPASNQGVLRKLASELSIPPDMLGLASEPRQPLSRVLIPRPRTGPSGGQVLAQLPPDMEAFVGRRSELDLLDQYLAERKRSSTVLITAISGTAGVGKTKLAIHWAHRVARGFRDGHMYVDLRGFSPTAQPMSPSDALRGFLGALRASPEDVPNDLDGQTALYRSTLAGKQMLIVLDNAEDTEHLLPLLPGSAGCVVLATSRTTLTRLVAAEGARPIPLGLFDEADVRALMADRIGDERVNAEGEVIAEITERCSGLPLALGIVAARAATQPTFPLAAFAAELRDERRRLDALDGDGAGFGVRPAFTSSYNRITTGAARLFRMLALHPGPETSISAIASVAAMPVAEVKPLLAELRRAHLITESLPDRYGFHDLLRAYAAELLGLVDADSERWSATRRLLDHYLYTAYAAARELRSGRDLISLEPPLTGTVPEPIVGPAEALTWFEAENAALFALIERAYACGLDTHAWKLTWTLDSYLDYQGRWQDSVGLWNAALETTQRLGDQPGESCARRALGRARTMLGQFDEAGTDLRHAIDLSKQQGHLVDQANAHGTLAHVLEQQCRYADALEQTGRAHVLFQQCGHLNGVAKVLNNQGWLHIQLGEPEKALDVCGRARALCAELGDHTGEADTWDSLGKAHWKLGNHEKALDCYRKAAGIFRNIGDQYWEGMTLVTMGEIDVEIGDNESARNLWSQALDIFSGIQNVSGVEAARARLADLH